MGRRVDLNNLLKTFTPNVYFQPPESVKMSYPAIVYHLDDADLEFADNAPYSMRFKYSLTLIDEDPDSDLRVKLLSLPLVSFSRHYTADLLNHDSFSLYF